MVRHEVQHAIPEEGHLREHLALARNASGQDAVKGGDAIRGDNEEVFAEIKNLADFAAA